MLAVSRKLTENFSFGSKNWLFQKEAKNYSEIWFFSTTLNSCKSCGKFWFDGNNIFWSNQWNRTNINENGFPPRNESHTAKLSFYCFMKHFRGNWLKTSLLGQKSDYLRKMLRITQKVIFSQPVLKWPNLPFYKKL